MALSRSTPARVLALAGMLAAALATAPSAQALTDQERFLIDLPTTATLRITADPSVPPPFCPRVDVVVARGTEEPANESPGLDGKAYWAESTYRGGPDSAAGVWWRMASELFFPTDGAVPLTAPTDLLRTDLTYQATNWFPGSTTGGTGNLLRYLNRMSGFCPATQFVLLGYSQGAAIIGDALSVPSRRILWFSGTDQLTTQATNQIAAVGLIGNPGFNRRQVRRSLTDLTLPKIVGGYADGTFPDRGGMNDGTFDPSHSGVSPRNLAAFPVRAVPSPLPYGTKASDFRVNPSLREDTGAKVRDYCKTRDYICQWGNWRSSVAVHVSYPTDDVARTNLLVFALHRLKPRL